LNLVGSEAGSYFRLIDVVYHSRVIQKKNLGFAEVGEGEGEGVRRLAPPVPRHQLL